MYFKYIPVSVNYAVRSLLVLHKLRITFLSLQVHKETIDKVPNALPNRNNIEIEIYGMEGIPEEDLKEHERQRAGRMGGPGRRQDEDDDEDSQSSLPSQSNPPPPSAVPSQGPPGPMGPMMGPNGPMMPMMGPMGPMGHMPPYMGGPGMMPGPMGPLGPMPPPGGPPATNPPSTSQPPNKPLFPSAAQVCMISVFRTVAVSWLMFCPVVLYHFVSISNIIQNSANWI